MLGVWPWSPLSGDLITWGFLGLLGVSDSSTALYAWAAELSDGMGLATWATIHGPLKSVLIDVCFGGMTLLPSNQGLRGDI